MPIPTVCQNYTQRVQQLLLYRLLIRTRTIETISFPQRTASFSQPGSSLPVQKPKALEVSRQLLVPTSFLFLVLSKHSIPNTQQFQKCSHFHNWGKKINYWWSVNEIFPPKRIINVRKFTQCCTNPIRKAITTTRMVPNLSLHLPCQLHQLTNLE